MCSLCDRIAKSEEALRAASNELPGQKTSQIVEITSPSALRALMLPGGKPLGSGKASLLSDLVENDADNDTSSSGSAYDDASIASSPGNSDVRYGDPQGGSDNEQDDLDCQNSDGTVDARTMLSPWTAGLPGALGASISSLLLRKQQN